MSAPVLYDWQQDFRAKIGLALARHQSVLAQASTGAGKTVLGSSIAHEHHASGRRVIFTVHRRSLITQTAATFKAFGIPHGYVSAGIPYSPKHAVYVASIDTLRRRLDVVRTPDMLVVDECHMAASRTWALVVKHYHDAGAKILGLSATPTRLDGKTLGDLFAEMVCGPPMSWLIEQGYLSRYVAYAPSRPDLAEVHTLGGDFKADELAAAMNRPAITGCAIEHYRTHADGMRAVAYCVDRRHSKDVAARFQAAGIPAAHIDGETPQNEQRDAITALADGRIRVLCNVELVTTGFDLSAQVGRDVPIEAVIGLRPTMSLALHLQMLGRGLRRKPTPAVILDHAGNLLRLGLPDDDRAWSLTPAPKRGRRQQGQELAVRECPACYMVHRPAPKCPNCGHVYVVVGREIEERDGELIQINRADRGAAPAPDEVRDWAYWFRIGKARADVRNPYAFAERQSGGRRVSIPSTTTREADGDDDDDSDNRQPADD